MRLLHLLVGQDLLQGPGQEHVFRLLPFIHERNQAGRGGGGVGWGRESGAPAAPAAGGLRGPGAGGEATGPSRGRRGGRAPAEGQREGRGVPTPARRLPARGGWDGPRRRRQPTPAAEGGRSLLLPSPTPPAPLRVYADGARDALSP